MLNDIRSRIWDLNLADDKNNNIGDGKDNAEVNPNANELPKVRQDQQLQ